MSCKKSKCHIFRYSHAAERQRSSVSSFVCPGGHAPSNSRRHLQRGEGGVDSTKLDVGVNDGSSGVVCLNISGSTAGGGTSSTDSTSGGGVSGVGRVEPEHVRVVLFQCKLVQWVMKSGGVNRGYYRLTSSHKLMTRTMPFPRASPMPDIPPFSLKTSVLLVAVF